MSKVKTVFITGCNRGIGWHLLNKISGVLKPEKIFATYRDAEKSKELLDFASNNSNVKLIQMDIRNFEKFDEIAKEVESLTGPSGLNLLINNAGITSKVAKISAVRQTELMDNLEINAVAPIMLTKALLPLLEKASAANTETSPGIARAAVINISSILASIGGNDQGGMYAYRCSKAAMNAATKSMSVDFKRSKIIAIALHPGWVQTDMGGPKAPLTPEQSVNAIVDLLQTLSLKQNGHFMQYDGKDLPW